MLGAISLSLFFLIIFGSIKKWIRQDTLPLQSVLVLGAILLVALALVFGRAIRPAELFASTTLHPITSTIAGFLLAGAVDTAGGFRAASRILARLSRGLLGLSGVVILLVNIPTIFAMPCGRVWAAALLPATLMFGMELARQSGNPSLLPAVVFGLIINAAASCGPSPLGGIGMMAEGTAGYPMNSFSNPQQVAILVITLLTMFVISRNLKITASPKRQTTGRECEEQLPESAYLAFAVYMAGLAAVFIIKPPIPIQTILLVLTILVMVAGNVGMKSLMAGMIIHPVTAMVAGFMMAGALVITGGFETLTGMLTWVATHTPLGFIGVSVILIYLPTILPMPCGRIIAAALLPGVIMFGQEVGNMTGVAHSLPAMLVAFILSCAASCAPSPLGGIGGIGEGNLGLKGGVISNPFQQAILLGTPVAALMVAYVGLTTEFFKVNELVVVLTMGGLAGVLSNLLVGERFHKPGGILGGLLVGALITVL